MILKQLERRASRRMAFTLMEVLVVVAILVILAGTASIAIFRYLEDAKKDKAHMDVQTLAGVVKKASLENSKRGEPPPERLEDCLQYIEGGSPGALIDPWGQQYRLTYEESNGQQNPVVSTTAPDGEDISSRKR